jgi:hypothetical protein
MIEKKIIEKKFPFKNIKLVSGVDRYGFSDVLYQQLKLIYRPRSFANWQHGWIWWKAKSSTELLLKNHDKKNSRLIVSNSHEKQMLEDEGYKNIWIGGLPFSYTENSKLKKSTNSLLAMPPHSAEVEKLYNPYTDYLDYLESIIKDYEEIYVSIYHLDKCENLIKEITKRGLKFIDGARPDDANSLRRMRAIFDTFEFVTSNAMGSHILYAIYCGCKTSICGPLYKYDADVFNGKNNENKHDKKYIEETLYYLSEKYLKEKFSFLFTQNPKYGFESLEYGAEEIGEKNKMNKKEIIEVLQWSTKNQIINYYKGGVRVVKRNIGVT